MRVILITLIICLFSHCDTKTNAIKRKNLKSHNLEFFGATITLPDTYEQLDLDELRERWLLSDLPIKQIRYSVDQLNALENLNTGFEIFGDSSNLNVIWFFEGPYVQLDNYTAQQLFNGNAQILKKHSEAIGLHCSYTENKYLALKTGYQIAKLKYKCADDSKIEYFNTQYLLSGKKRTLGVMVTNPVDDFEDLIKRIYFDN